MSYEQIKSSFDRHGFVVVPEFLNGDNFDELNRELNRYMGEIVPTLSDSDAFYDDRGTNWSSPQTVPVDLTPEKYTWNKAGRLIRFSDQRWMYPFETWKPPGYGGPPGQKAAAVFSSDGGGTWGGLTIIADDVDGRLMWWDQMNTGLAEATFGEIGHENFLAEHLPIAFGKPQGFLDADGTLLTFFW